MSRTKTVYKTYEIAHLWAHQSVERARNPQHNFSFNGGSLESYGTEIGRICYPVVLMATDRISATTSKHQSAMRGAIPGHLRVIQVDDNYAGKIKVSDKLLADRFTRKASEALVAMGRARSEERKDYLAANVYRQIEMAQRAIEFRHDIGLESTELLEAFIEGYSAITVNINGAAKRAAKAFAERAKLENEKKKRKHADNIAAWRLSGWPRPNLKFAILRIDNESVITSKGTSVPLSSALALYRASLLDRNRLVGMKVGPFEVEAINDHHIKIGCTRIEWAEIENVIRPEYEKWMSEKVEARTEKLSDTLVGEESPGFNQ